MGKCLFHWVLPRDWPMWSSAIFNITVSWKMQNLPQDISPRKSHPFTTEHIILEKGHILVRNKMGYHSALTEKVVLHTEPIIKTNLDRRLLNRYWQAGTISPLSIGESRVLKATLISLCNKHQHHELFCDVPFL